MYLCGKCSSDLRETTEDKGQEYSDNKETKCCIVCLGIRQDIRGEEPTNPEPRTCLSQQVKLKIDEALKPYGGINLPENFFSERHSPPTISLPGDIVYRYQLVANALRQRQQAEGGRLDRNVEPLPLSDFVQQLKSFAKNTIDDILGSRTDSNASKEMTGRSNEYPHSFLSEEQGFLAIHVIVTPKKGVVRRPNHVIPSSVASKKRRRYGGPVKGSNTQSGTAENIDDNMRQGGDARSNLERRLLVDECITHWTLNQAMAATPFTADTVCDKDILTAKNFVGAMFDAYVAVWRRPFYIRGCYTKTRRNVSQTPFFVMEKGVRKQLSATSVQEEILSVVERKCGGISKLNNDNDQSSDTLFGMSKFHASGREDMDVRMLLPSTKAVQLASNGQQSVSVTRVVDGSKVTGRPFCCEIVDALRLPKQQDLEEMVHEINHTSSEPTPNNILIEDQSMGTRSYGINPTGVGVAPSLSFAVSSTYRNLQSETENKVKYYGCLCWSKSVFSSSEEIQQRLGSFPLEIQQRTPLRVLHRRPNMVRPRTVRTCFVVERLDDHFFRLHLSTDAGTYVKEFVHGDLGRTFPSVSSLLGCKTDILELDCEGIAAG